MDNKCLTVCYVMNYYIHQCIYKIHLKTRGTVSFYTNNSYTHMRLWKYDPNIKIVTCIIKL